MINNELYHHGVKGMKWGVIRKSGITGNIRDLQRKNANNTLNDVRTKKKQVNDELRELNGYDKNPSKIGSSKISKAIRRSQIKSLTKTKNDLNLKERDAKSALKEPDSIEKYQQNKKQNKKQMSTQKKMAIGAAAVATILASGYGSYKVSKLLKSEAGKRATKAGQEHLRRNINAGKLISDMNKEGKLTRLNSKDWGKKVASDLDRDIDLVNQVSGSTKEAIKYLYNNRKK